MVITNRSGNNARNCFHGVTVTLVITMENYGEAYNENHRAAHQPSHFLYPRFQVARDTEACGFNPLISFLIDSLRLT